MENRYVNSKTPNPNEDQKDAHFKVLSIITCFTDDLSEFIISVATS